jgi:serine/threonine protein kinase
MILLDIINNINDDLVSDSDSSNIKNNIILKFSNKYDNYTEIIKDIINKPIQFGESIDVKCKICSFLGSGSYGKVYKIKINKKYYALKISENEKPENFKKRYESLTNIDIMKKYIIDIYIAGNIKCGKYEYFSIMEFGGSSLKSKIPLEDVNELDFVLRQLYNISYLCSKHKLILTDFKLNNIVINSDCRLKLIDLYMDCKSYSPCRECRIVKTYSTMEIDKIKGILDDCNYKHTYHLIPLAIGLIDLLCKKSASTIITNVGYKFGIFLGIKQLIPLIQVACYNYTHKSNNLIRNYKEVYHLKKKIEKKYPVVLKKTFYETLMSSFEIRDIYQDKFSKNDFQLIIHHLFSACPTDRTIEPLKKILNNNCQEE